MHEYFCVHAFVASPKLIMHIFIIIAGAEKFFAIASYKIIHISTYINVLK